MTIKEICRQHGLDLERGSRVLCDGRFGTVSGASGPFLRVKFDGNQISSPCDPLDVRPLDQAAGGQAPPAMSQVAATPA
ncbi:hypothetical protein [Variovorax sp. W6]|uniref:hypothetical protein n=1 Tax=Variovorax sp. W6 TaxID=3093895 RepID=UPI003D800E3B